MCVCYNYMYNKIIDKWLIRLLLTDRCVYMYRYRYTAMYHSCLKF